MERLRHRLFGQFAVYAGNTAALARTLAEAVDADVCEIRTLEPYPADYRETTEAAKRELAAQARPAIAGELPDLSDRDEIYLGYPNYCGTMPMAVYTFLEAFNFTGKTIHPFCTHEGSRFGRSERDLKALCPQARMLEGFEVRGSRVSGAADDVNEWLSGLGFKTAG